MSTKDRNSNDFAIRLKEARLKRTLSQTELAAKAKMVPSAIAHFEGARRKPSFANIRALSQALSVTSDYLLSRTENMKGATTVFRGEEELSSADRDWIQMIIDSKIGESKK